MQISQRGVAVAGFIAALTVGSFSTVASAQSPVGNGGGGPGDVTVTSGPVTANAAGGSSVAIASCSGNQCSVTLGGSVAEVTVFDTTIVWEGIQDGQATLRVGDQYVSCVPGQSVSVGAVALACTAVTQDTVTFTATRG
jgi:hypothetical protein